MKIKVSWKSASLLWNGCQLDYIKNTCGGRCCKDGKGNSHIAIMPSEEENIIKLGGAVKNGLLVNKAEGGCPFWEKGLCTIHFTGHKPLTCWTSPFTLNDNNTLIVKNRNKKLICYNQQPQIKTYKAYYQSLLYMFGADIADEITRRLDNTNEDFYIEVDRASVENIQWIRLKTKGSIDE